MLSTNTKAHLSRRRKVRIRFEYIVKNKLLFIKNLQIQFLPKLALCKLMWYN